ncbi:MAG: hypothetical protein FWC01_06045 [Treponema sp.]|nr:hypothetical protein [Treponema sp.]MCL2237417.1 hypothetical protein [Treponema sp.]
MKALKSKYRFFLSACFAFLFFLVIVTPCAHAQNSGAYLIPSQIFIGDPATLVLRLPASARNENIVISDAEYFPQDPNIDFHLIVLERRTTGSRLMIDFTPFATGHINLPPIEIGEERFENLSFSVNSLIDGKSPNVLSAAAAALAMPGTAGMLYGSMAALVVFILAAVWFLFKGRTVFKLLREKWKRKRLFANMRTIEKRLARALSKGIDRRKILDRLSEEFRDFLSILTGNNCRSMTASEFFGGMSFENLNPSVIRDSEQRETAVFLGNFFQKCDELRFSGMDIDAHEISRLLEDFGNFIDLAQMPKEKQQGNGEASQS